MSTYRFPLRGKAYALCGTDGELLTRRIGVQRDLSRAKRRNTYLLDPVNELSEEEIRNLPIAHRYSS
jgi:hypothetical protein